MGAMEPTSRRIHGAHGIDLHMLAWSSEGVPIVMLHGFGNECRIWGDLGPLLAPYYHVVALDQRGHGDSSWDPEARYDVDDMTDDLECVLETLGFERLVLIGHSMGGRVSTNFGGRHPDRLAGLVLVDIGPELDPRGPLRMRQEVETRQKPRFGSIEEYAGIVSHNYPASSPEATLRMARDELKQCADGLYELKMDPALRDVMASRGSDAQLLAKEEEMIQRQWDALAKIPCPTLLVRGAASDFLSPEIADKMVEEVIPNAQLAVVPQAGHSVMTDNPEGFCQVVTDFAVSE
jgi:pimeloyl-ACP methyl ester carboxylesterase